MLELTGWGDILRGIALLYWLTGGYLVYLCIKKSATRFGKIGNGLAVAFLFGFLPLKSCIDQALHVRNYQARLAKAEAIFNERCKTAGEKIYRTVENVDGIYLLKLRPFPDLEHRTADDPYGTVAAFGSGDAYIISFFIGRSGEQNRLDSRSREHTGYRYVDADDPSTGQRYRYTVSWWKDPKWHPDIEPEIRLEQTPTDQPAPRYGVIYEDLSTPDERAYWIAGSVLRVVDLQTHEILAERIGYMMDRGQQEADSPSRLPWAFAKEYSCPYPAPSRDFVDKVLKIKEF